MGMTYEKHKAHKRQPWPRYRVAFWGETTMSWRELAPVYYSPASVIEAANKRVKELGDKVRICIMHSETKKEDMTLETFEVGYGQKAKG